MSTTTDFPRWIMGGPDDRSTAIVPTLLREVSPGLYVGSENATDFMPVTWGTHGALVQLSSSCAPVGEIPTYRWTFNDGGPVPGALLDDVVRFVSQWRAKGPVLVQCQAGLSRSASVAYGILRVLDGLDHTEALRRIETREEHYDRPLVWPRRPTLESVVAWAEARGASRLSVPALVTVEEAERQALQAALNAADGAEGPWCVRYDAETGPVRVPVRAEIKTAALERASGTGAHDHARGDVCPGEDPGAPTNAATEGTC